MRLAEQENLNILIIEDDQDIREALAQLLSLEGYKTLQAVNGQEALDLLAKCDLPALILLDLFMPVMDGFEFRLRQLANLNYAKIPVIVMTADSALESKKSKLNAFAYFKKPLNIAILLSTITSALKGN